MTQSHPEDIEAWIELAVLLEERDPAVRATSPSRNRTEKVLTLFFWVLVVGLQQALKVYKQALAYLQGLEETVPPELCNNVAGLLLLTGSYSEAQVPWQRQMAEMGHGCGELLA